MNVFGLFRARFPADRRRIGKIQKNRLRGALRSPFRTNPAA
ncbi:MAG: hypothetical protein QOG72_3401 [Sphingomonadales bacterium]|jgi:hypothetical protein|nr:hypothetical protein [Sphingomonadales bacterium]